MRGSNKFSKKSQVIIESLKKEKFFEFLEIPNQGLCCLHNFIFTTGIIVGIDESGYKGRYCYGDPIDAIKAFLTWDGVGDPSGNWIKYKGKGGERINSNYSNK